MEPLPNQNVNPIYVENLNTLVLARDRHWPVLSKIHDLSHIEQLRTPCQTRDDMVRSGSGTEAITTSWQRLPLSALSSEE